MSAIGNPAATSRATRAAWTLFGVATGLALLVAALRVWFNLSLRAPLQTLTSGFEDESLFAIWKWVHGRQIYADPRQIPFAASYFNWGFYWLYGTVTHLILMLGQLPDDWITQIGKWISLCGAAVLGWAGWRILADEGIGGDKEAVGIRRWIALVTAVYLTVSPHMGFWIITTRPDVWALAFEVLALGSYLRHLKTGKPLDLFFFFLFSYAAWSFKQVNITMAAACIVDLMLRGHWKTTAVMLAGLAVACGATLLLGGGDYRYLLVRSQSHMGVFLSIGVENFSGALKKNPLAWIPWLAMCVLWASRKLFWKTALIPGPVRVLNLAALIGLLFFLPLSCKVGAADNYFLPFSICALMAWVVWTLNRPELVTGVAIGGAAGLTVAGCVLLLAGKHGRLDCRGTDLRAQVLKASLARLPRPVLAWDNFASLPWINPGDPDHFVLCCGYYSFSTNQLEHGGVENMVATGHFASVVDFGGDHRDLCERHLQPVASPDFPGTLYLRREIPAKETP